MSITGLHHISIVVANAQRTVDFYTKVLGLRFVKKTVNFDDPGLYHLYFGDETGSPGSLLTFFEIPGARKGRPGLGGTHHVALTVADSDGLRKWKRRLTDLDLDVTGPLDRHYFESIYFTDPDGLILEIATMGPGFTRDEDQLGRQFMTPPAQMVVRNRDEEAIAADTWPEPVPDITPDMALSHGMHHITAIGTDIARTHAYYADLLGLQRVKMTSNFDDPDSAHWYWGLENGRPGTLITYFERTPGKETRAVGGAGQTHHFAFSTPDEESQLALREKLVEAGYRVTDVKDRVYFKSIYTNDPDGHVVEIATAGPGFMVDEEAEKLGSGLMLPPWLENRREMIEANLTPITQETTG
ncbi:MAG: VOC family protein [Anaerolineae bacterium]